MAGRILETEPHEGWSIGCVARRCEMALDLGAQRLARPLELEARGEITAPAGAPARRGTRSSGRRARNVRHRARASRRRPRHAGADLALRYARVHRDPAADRAGMPAPNSSPRRRARAELRDLRVPRRPLRREHRVADTVSARAAGWAESRRRRCRRPHQRVEAAAELQRHACSAQSATSACASARFRRRERVGRSADEQRVWRPPAHRSGPLAEQLSSAARAAGAITRRPCERGEQLRTERRHVARAEA